MDNIINLEKNILENAKISACKIKDKETRIRAYALNIAANITAQYFDKIGLASDTGLSLYKIPSFQENFELADVYVKGFRFDVRISFDGVNFTIPKIHEKFGAVPLAYVVINLDENLNTAKFLGFIPTEGITYPESNSEYYNMNVSVLKPMEAVKELIENSTLSIHPYSANNHEKIKELSASFIDGEISDSEKIFFIKHIVACPVCRETFCDISDFDTIVMQIKNYQELLNDSTLSVLSGNRKEVEEALLANLGLPQNAEENCLDSETIEENVIDLNEHTEDEKEKNDDSEQTLYNTQDEVTEDVSDEVLDFANEDSTLNFESNTSNPEDTWDDISLDDLDSIVSETSEVNNMAQELAEKEDSLIDDSILETLPVDDEELINIDNDVLNEINEVSLEQNVDNSENQELNVLENNLSENPIQLEDDVLDIVENNVAENEFESEPIEELIEVENIQDFQLQAEEENALIDFSEDTVLEQSQEIEPIEESMVENTNVIEVLENPVELIAEEEDLLIENESQDLENVQAEGEDIKSIIVDEIEPIIQTEEIEQPVAEDTVKEFYQNSYVPPQPVELNYDEDNLLEENVSTSNFENEQENYIQNDDETNSEIQELLDDDLRALLTDENNIPEVNQVDYSTNASQTILPEVNVQDLEPEQNVGLGAVEKQVVEDENINNLFEAEEGVSTDNSQTSTFELAQEPISDEVIKKTKNYAIVAALLIVLLGAGSSMLVFNKHKMMNTDEAQQGNEMFDFASKSEDDANQIPAVSQDINRSMTNSFSDKPAAITITKLSWQVSEKLAIEPSVKEYLQIAGKNIQMNLQDDLANSADVAFNNIVKVSFTISPDNTLKGLQILESSGSDKIDNDISTSIKNTLKYVNVPKLKDYKSDYFLTLIINF